MTHNARIRIDPNWSLGSTWLSSEQSTLDTNLRRALNGDGGGTWTPSANIVWAGAGLRLVAGTHIISGSGSTVATNGTTALLNHGDDDYSVLGPGHSGATQTLVTAIARGIGNPTGSTLGIPGWTFFGLSGFFLTSALAPFVGATLRIPLDVHDGAALSQVVFPWQVLSQGSTSGYNQVPLQMPKFGVFAVDILGVRHPLSVLSPYQAIPTPASPAAFYASGGQQSFTFASDSAAANPYVTVNKARYSYFAEIVDATGYPAPVVLYGDLTATFSNILDQRPR